MIIIEDKLVSNAIIEEQFICDLKKCKGACCIEGDGGAPLATEELGILEDIYDDIEPYLTEAGKIAIMEQGLYVADSESEYSDCGFVTPLLKNGACAYLITDELGIPKCGIQKAYEDGVVNFPKPISCHLYPIRITSEPNFEAINYDDWDICSAACGLGKAHQVYLYEFLKEPLIRKYGKSFYHQLDAAAKHLR